MSIREEFEKALAKKFYAKNVQAVHSPKALWAAKWMAEYASEHSTGVCKDYLRQLAKELSP